MLESFERGFIGFHVPPSFSKTHPFHLSGLQSFSNGKTSEAGMPKLLKACFQSIGETMSNLHNLYPGLDSVLFPMLRGVKRLYA
jgi:hypothetical protein